MLNTNQASGFTIGKAKCFKFLIVKNEDIRRENARLLMKEAGGNESFAMKIGKDPAYTSQLVGKNPRRNIGVTMARHIEECFARPSGWLDTPHAGVLGANVMPASIGPALKAVPLINYVQAAMCDVMVPLAIAEGWRGVTTDADVSHLAFALEITGDSMEPLFSEGDRVVIDPHVSPQPGDFVVGRNKGEEAIFRKYRPRGTGPDGGQVFELVPLNTDYPTLRSDADHMRVIGTMVEHRRYRRRH